MALSMSRMLARRLPGRCFPAMTSGMADQKRGFQFLSVETPSPFVAQVQLNRPEKRNAINMVLWREIGEAFKQLASDPDCRAIVLSSNDEKGFSAGIDLMDLMAEGNEANEAPDVARKTHKMYDLVSRMQGDFTELEKCDKPVIAAIHGACVGAAVDLIVATDIRLCSKDAWFCVKEVDIGLAADIGTLQRLPKIVRSESFVREICLTGRRVGSEEALSQGLVSSVHEDKDRLIEAALNLAKVIAAKSPVAAQGTKHFLVHARDHTVAEGLESMARWNGAMLQSEDVMKSAMASFAKDKEPPTFAKL